MSEKTETTVRITKNSRSPIWRYFEPTTKTSTRCLLCDQTYRNSGNTTNLIDHLKRKHKDTHVKFLEQMKSSKENSTIVLPLTITPMVESGTASTEIPVENIKYETEDQSEVVESAQLEISEESSAIINSEAVEQESLLEQDSNQMEAGQIVEDIKSGNIIIETEEGQHDVQVCKIVPLPHARSEVWTYFGFVADQEGQILDRSKVVCRLCSSSFCYSGNTTNFYSHLKSMHSEVQIRSVPVKNTRSVKRTYSSMNDNADETDYLNDAHLSMVNHSNLSHEVSLADDESIPPRSRADLIHVDDITHTIVDFLVTDCRPLAVTQGKGFQQMLRLLAPGYTLPDKAKLAQVVRRKYDQMRKEREQNVVERMNTLDY